MAAPQFLPPSPQTGISPSTPMGATLVPGGATFRFWAPNAHEVQLLVRGGERTRLLKQDDDTWTGFASGILDGTAYRLYVIGDGSSGLKRDPWARELAATGFPDCDCIARSSSTYPWHDAGFKPAPHHDLVIYQLHTGAFFVRTW